MPVSWFLVLLAGVVAEPAATTPLAIEPASDSAPVAEAPADDPPALDRTALPAEPLAPPPPEEPEPVPPAEVTVGGAASGDVSTDGVALVEDRDDDDDDDHELEIKTKKNKKISFSVGGRVMAGFELEDKRPSAEQSSTPGMSNEFFLRQARVKLGVDYKKIFRLRFSVELADALKNFNVDRIAYLRNGYGEARFHKAARLRFGYFKRPFSRLELRSPRDLPIRGRGLANGRIIEDRNYGDRSVGGMLHGKFSFAKLRYAVGVFAPALRAQGVDAVGRLSVKPWKWLSVGAGGLYKRIENGTGDKVDVGGASADFRIDYKGLAVLGDVVLGRDYLVPTEPWSLGVVGYTSYDIDLPKKLVLQPVVLGEWSDIDIGVSQNDAVRVIAGVNLIWRKRFRVMPQAEFIRPLGVTGNPWVEKDTYYLMLTLDL